MAIGICINAFLLVFSADLALSRKCPCVNPSLCNTISHPPGKELYHWTVKPKLWRQYDWTKITTIALFRDWDDELLCFAHSKGVRVVLAVDFPMKKIDSKEVREEWVKSKIKFALDNFADGINIDIESPVAKGSKEVNLLTELVKLTVESFKKSIPGSQVTFDVPYSPNCIAGRCYDYKALADNLDFLILMAYDLGSLIKIAGANSPYYKSIKGIEEYKKLNISTHKLVLGLPWYGYDYTCVKFNITSGICYINCKLNGACRQVTYSTIQDLLVSRTDTGRKWDTRSKSPYFLYNDQYGYVHQVWYDDPSSLSIKYRYASEYGNMKGIAIWNADLLDYGGLTRGSLQTHVMWKTLPTTLGGGSRGAGKALAPSMLYLYVTFSFFYLREKINN